MPWTSFMVLMLLYLSYSAAAHADVAGAADYAGFERFPGATIVDYRRENSTVYSLALGRMQRVTGRVAPSESERFQGDLRRITYEIPRGFTAGEVYDHYRRQLLSNDQRALFFCQGRDCGSSNFWANDVFGNRILYGPESSQYYLASTYDSEAGEQQVRGVAALYVVVRGNRRLYAHLDFLELDAAQRQGLITTPEAMQRQLNREGTVVLPRVSFDANDQLQDEGGIELLVNLLQVDSLLEIYVVGHLQGDEPLAILTQRSRQRAEQVAASLVEAGIAVERVQAQGLGPLAPYCRPGPCSQRIEIVAR